MRILIVNSKKLYYSYRMKADSIPIPPETVSDVSVEAETKREFVLTKGDQTKIVKNAEEADNAIREGYNARGLQTELDLKKIFGVDVDKIRREREVKKLEARFFENSNLELLYLSEGIEEWFEDVNNYWYNSQNRHQSSIHQTSEWHPLM